MGLDLYILKAEKEEDFGNNSFENIISYGGSAAYLTRNLIFEYLNKLDYEQKVIISYSQLKELLYFLVKKVESLDNALIGHQLAVIWVFICGIAGEMAVCERANNKEYKYMIINSY